MTKESKLKKWSWYKIVNLVVLIILTIVFTVLFVINQKKYTIAFLISVLLLGIWVTGYFMGHFLFMNKENIKDGTRKLFDDYRKKDKNKESKAEKIKQLEKELAELKKEEED
ncbi:hypothetical protein [Spiroplasma endosymbiont of Glossina fuscipes fuscipes]|uniref:hypothetical protein n=1 Tax=Spiroplasma endosymbiont of Glossina fuscipes fuscipes TaxID=2004463 RepID=UPI003CF75E23